MSFKQKATHTHTHTLITEYYCKKCMVELSKKCLKDYGSFFHNGGERHDEWMFCKHCDKWLDNESDYTKTKLIKCDICYKFVENDQDPRHDQDIHWKRENEDEIERHNRMGQSHTRGDGEVYQIVYIKCNTCGNQEEVSNQPSWGGQGQEAINPCADEYNRTERIDKGNKDYCQCLFKNELVYKKLPKGVLEALKIKTPKSKRLHQSLTPEIGKEHLKKQIHSVEAYGKISDTKEDLLKFVEKAYPSQQKLSSKKQETDFDKVLKNAINTPPLKLKDLKERLRKEQEEKKKL